MIWWLDEFLILGKRNMGCAVTEIKSVFKVDFLETLIFISAYDWRAFQADFYHTGHILLFPDGAVVVSIMWHGPATR
jgi:hypothetical protein